MSTPDRPIYLSTVAMPDFKKGSIELKPNGRRFPVTAGLAVTLVAAAVAVAGCSSSSSSAGSPKANGAGVTASSTGSARLAQFAQCMRAHGVTNFPDATAQGTFDLPPGMTTSPQFASADGSCRSLAPPGSLSAQGPTTRELNQTVKFVSCMRKHGQTGFPDPTANGKFQLNGGANPIDPNSPQFKSAMSACHSLLPPGSGFGTGG